MIESFSTQEEADAKAKELDAQDAEWFCPLIKEQCRKTCVCFSKASIVCRKYDKVPFTVYPPRCENAMFTEHEIQQS